MHKLFLNRCAALGIIVFAGAACFSHSASAATITVTTTVDDLTTNGNCTLREAIQAANTNTTVDACTAGASSTADTITLGANTYTLSITGTGEDNNQTGDLDVTSGSVVINGAGQNSTTITANGASFGDRIIDIISGSTIIQSLTIRGGYVSDSGGGIQSTGSLTLSGVLVTSNTAAGTGGFGGGIYSDVGTLYMSDTTVASNTAGFQAGGIEIDSGTLTMTKSTVSENSAAAGGGVGGLVNFATATIDTSTIAANTSSSDSGGIYNAGTMTLTNVTVARNTAVSGFGGIWNDTGTLNVKNSIIALNVDSSGASPDCGGSAFASQGYNLIESTIGCTITGTTTGNILGTDPQLSSTLAINNSTSQLALTKNYLPLSNSPVIDAGTNTGCPSLDQRYFSRPQVGISGNSSVCDIGAVEVDYVSPTLTLTTAPTLYAKLNSSASTMVVTSSETGTVVVSRDCTSSGIVSASKQVTAATITTSEGVKTCSFVFSDLSGNSTGLSVDYTIDGTYPGIVVNGPKTIFLKRGSTYSESGATVTDNLDPTVTYRIRNSTPALNTAVAGQYWVGYDATDAAGNNTKTYTGSGPYGTAYRYINVLPSISDVKLTGRSLRLGTKTITPFPGYGGSIFARKITYSASDAHYVFVTSGATSAGRVRVYNASGQELTYAKQSNVFGTQPRISLPTWLTAGGVNIDIAANETADVVLALSPARGRIQPMVINLYHDTIWPVPLGGTPSGGAVGNVIPKFIRLADTKPFLLVAGIKNRPETFRLYASHGLLYTYQSNANLKPYGFSSGQITNSQPIIRNIRFGPIVAGNMTFQWSTNLATNAKITIGSTTYTQAAAGTSHTVSVPASSAQAFVASISSCRPSLTSSQGCTDLGKRSFTSF